MKFTNHHELRKRKSIDCSLPVKTDQSSKAMADINNIMLQYSKTGLLPHTKEKLASYIDNTKIMPLMEAHELIQDAKSMFMELPSQIRKLMDNDPTKLVSFIKDETNFDILVKHGVLEKKQVEKAKPSDPLAVAKISKDKESKDSK